MHRNSRFTRATAWLLALLLCLSCVELAAFAADPTEPIYTSSSDHGDGTFDNDAVVDSDVPDPDIIRVGDAYYMTSTSMHFSPGVPIMKSYDLVNWEVVSYVYNVLADYDKLSMRNGGYDYGKGSWATSLRYREYDHKFYLSHTCNTTNKTYFYSTDDIENGTWEQIVCNTFYHDGSLLFEGENIYMFSGSGTIKCDKLKPDFSGSEWSHTVITADATTQVCNNTRNTFLEATHAYKVGDTYYIFMCVWPSGWTKAQLVFKSKTVDSGYEGRVIINDSYGRSEGLAQGGIVDMVDGSTQTTGKWMGFFMHLRGAAGRGLVLTPCTFDANGWPIVANSSNKVPINSNMAVPVEGEFELKSVVNSTDFDNDAPRPAYTYQKIPASNDPEAFAYNGSNLPLGLEWNHNPDNRLWSMTERDGYLRLTNGYLATSVTDCKNVLTARTYGPECSAHIAMEIDGMKNGDIAGLAAFHRSYGYCGVKMENDKKYIIYRQRDGNSQDADFSNKDPWIESVLMELDDNVSRVYFKVYNDYRTYRNEYAHFYYSVDGESWVDPGKSRLVEFGYPTHFDGARFGIFNFATKELGGYVDVDYFELGDGAPKEVADPHERLTSLINKADKLTASDYSAATWKTLTAALTDAKKVNADEAATEEALDAACTALRTALNGLATNPRRVLADTIAKANALNKLDYEANSWVGLFMALTRAQETYDNIAASEDDCDLAAQALSAALAALRYQGAPSSDYFADGEVNADLWTVVNENKATYSVEPGKGVVLPTQLNDIYGDGSGWENCFTMSAKGDWQAVAKVVYPQVPNANYQQAMMLVWQDDNNYIRMNCQQESLKLEPGVETDGSFSASLGSGNASAAADGTVTLYYQIEKQGNDYTVGYSQDGKRFTTLGTATVAYTDPKIGLFATQNSDNPTINTYFEYVYITKCSGMEDSSYAEMLAWAAGNVADYLAAAIPEETSESIALPAAPHGYSVQLASSDAAVIAADGKVTPAKNDKYVTLTLTVDGAQVEKTVKVPGTEGPCTHEYEQSVVAPTCTEPGTIVSTCKLCGHSYSEEGAPALGHAWDDGRMADDGNSITYTCTRCGETRTESRLPPPPLHDCPSENFTDVPGVGDWAHAGIDYCVEKELMNGTSATLFSPKGSVTRAQLVTILYRVEGEPEVTEPSKFTDVPADQWYTDAIAWAAASGIVTGMNETTFAPMNKITREQIATILYRYTDGATAEGSIDSFPDAAKVSGWAKEGLTWAVAHELITGVKAADGTVTLNPTANATRAQIASIMMRYLES